jgi:hypothetical protein
MTLSGVLKDILLVCASLMIFRDPVTRIQVFGYAIALAGLVYYKLGLEKIKEYIGAGRRSWADFGARRPVARKLTTTALVFVGFLLLLTLISGLGVVPADYDPVHHANSFLRKAMGGFGKTGQ